MVETTPDILKSALKPPDKIQYNSLRKLINDGKVLTTAQQKKYDEYETQIEAYQTTQTPKYDSPYVIKMVDACAFYGKSRVAIQLWQGLSGYPKHAHQERGKVDLKILNDWVINHFYGDADTAISMAQAKLRREIAKARRDELLTKELEGSLISLEKITEDFVFILSILKTRITSWVKRIPPKVKMMEEKPITKILNSETRDILIELSKGVKGLVHKRK
ncbi:MAG: hypothetical protein WC623_24530 [Pedobacter sp.]|uniref:hypothetical protein n=1 Tax=Pedobacter sp. TaxID=1411316 RepID=UPI00356A76B6